MKTIIQKDLTEATADKDFFNQRITDAEQQANLVGVVANMQRYVSIVIPTAREAEFNAADADTKVKFVQICQAALLREATEGDYLTVFEDEYNKIFG